METTVQAESEARNNKAQDDKLLVGLGISDTNIIPNSLENKADQEPEPIGINLGRTGDIPEDRVGSIKGLSWSPAQGSGEGKGSKTEMNERQPPTW